MANEEMEGRLGLGTATEAVDESHDCVLSETN